MIINACMFAICQVFFPQVIAGCTCFMFLYCCVFVRADFIVVASENGVTPEKWFLSFHVSIRRIWDPGFKHGFPNLQEQHFACWCEDFLDQRLWTYLSSDTWGCHAFSRMQWNIGQQWSCGLCHPSLLNLDMLFWWHLMFLDQKKWGHPVRCIKDTLSIPSLFEFETFLAKSSCIQPHVSRSRFLQKAVEIQNWLHHNPIWGCGAAAIKVILGSLGQPMQP